MHIYFVIWLGWILGVLLPLTILLHFRLKRIKKNFKRHPKDNSLKEKILCKMNWGMPIDRTTQGIQIAILVSIIMWFGFGFYVKSQTPPSDESGLVQTSQ